MLAVHCPRCGRPTPASLASPDVLRCPACHYGGPPHPEAARNLRAAAQVLFQRDVRRRQLSESVRRTLISASRRRARVLVLFGITALPISLLCALLALGIAVSPDVEGDVLLGTMVAATWLAALGAGASFIALINRRQRRLEEACAARPPAAPGEPAACHVCGATLGGGAEGIARCGFCGADNVVAPAVLARVQGRQSMALDALERAMHVELERVQRATTGGGILVVISAVVVPFVVFFLAVIVGVIIEAMQLDLDRTVRYALAPTRVGRCAGKLVSPPGTPVVVRFGTYRPEALEVELRFASAADVEPLAPESMIGRAVTTGGETGVVSALLLSPFRGNSAIVDVGGGRTRTTSIAGLCLASRAPAER